MRTRPTSPECSGLAVPTFATEHGPDPNRRLPLQLQWPLQGQPDSTDWFKLSSYSPFSARARGLLEEAARLVQSHKLQAIDSGVILAAALVVHAEFRESAMKAGVDLSSTTRTLLLTLPSEPHPVVGDIYPPILWEVLERAMLQRTEEGREEISITDLIHSALADSEMFGPGPGNSWADYFRTLGWAEIDRWA